MLTHGRFLACVLQAVTKSWRRGTAKCLCDRRRREETEGLLQPNEPTSEEIAKDREEKIKQTR